MTKLEVWTRFAESALNGVLVAKGNSISQESPVKTAARYADDMVKEWEKKKQQLEEERLAPYRE
ncbi:hypothetical protein FHW68_000621 [Pseudomonas sp. Tn43]|uniref:hypothetical protein n=1 Tax=Pseudomonas sp. Tn43 TaxID=701213 RepID=UPI00161C440D|nr:hypothetical protein [Pseudomonas sp. Tn43]MBB3239149.1 hypothetical protein [Pseudomonas sp. Tn43]